MSEEDCYFSLSYPEQYSPSQQQYPVLVLRHISSATFTLIQANQSAIFTGNRLLKCSHNNRQRKRKLYHQVFLLTLKITIIFEFKHLESYTNENYLLGSKHAPKFNGIYLNIAK